MTKCIKIFLYLEYPSKLHNQHNAYPFCPSHKKISEDLLSPYQKYQAKRLDIKPGLSPKLIADLTNKKKYVLHFRNLQQAIHYGLECTHISRILSFNQERWSVAFLGFSLLLLPIFVFRLANFITFNTNMRQKATNKFERDFWKLMNNSFYGSY